MQRLCFCYIYLFIFGCAGSLLLQGVSESRGCSLVAVFRLLLAVASLCCGAWARGHSGFSSCGTWAQQLGLPGSREHRLNSCGAWA